MTRKKTRDRFLDAVDETYEAMLSAVEATEARGHRVSTAVFEEARKGEQELLGLTRQWVDSPMDFFENLTAMIDIQARAQRRALELVRDSLHGAGEYRDEVRDALRRVIKANRQATDATLDVARDAFSSTIERVRGGNGALGKRAARPTKVPVTAGNGAKD